MNAHLVVFLVQKMVYTEVILVCYLLTQIVRMNCKKSNHRAVYEPGVLSDKRIMEEYLCVSPWPAVCCDRVLFA